MVVQHGYLTDNTSQHVQAHFAHVPPRQSLQHALSTPLPEAAFKTSLTRQALKQHNLNQTILDSAGKGQETLTGGSPGQRMHQDQTPAGTLSRRATIKVSPKPLFLAQVHTPDCPSSYDVPVSNVCDSLTRSHCLDLIIDLSISVQPSCFLCREVFHASSYQSGLKSDGAFTGIGEQFEGILAEYPSWLRLDKHPLGPWREENNERVIEAILD